VNDPPRIREVYQDRIMKILVSMNDETVCPPPCTIRPCAADDVATLLALVRGLAEYERLEAFVHATLDDFRAHLFGARPCAEAILAEVGSEAVGFALYFPTFASFRGRPGIWLEDLFVRPEYRGRGIGKALMAQVARVAVERGGGRLEWSVLDWNESAIGFYQSLGARLQAEWLICRVDGESLQRLAES
jgi:GNAT superfamily N-acetyltransferase